MAFTYRRQLFIDVPPIMWHHKAHLRLEVVHFEKILAMVPESVELSRKLHLS